LVFVLSYVLVFQLFQREVFVRRYKLVKREEEQLELVENVCDVPGCGMSSASGVWEDGDEVRMVEVSCTVLGKGEKKVLEVDLCPECFDEKIVRYLRAIGVEAEYK
jgi:hypothetical protein